MKKIFLTQVGKIENQIHLIRGQRVMLSGYLSQLYGVETKALLQAVKRNLDRFPEDFMFQLSWEEAAQYSRSQIVTLKKGQNIKYRPYAFTQEGIAMLSRVLRSQRAIQMNIVIMHTFVKLRELYSTQKELVEQLKALKEKVGKHGIDIQGILEAMRVLINRPENPKRKICFHSDPSAFGFLKDSAVSKGDLTQPLDGYSRR